MKKLMYIAAAAAVLMGTASCSQSGKQPKAALNNEIDSLSYSIGVLNCDPRMKTSLKDQFGIDSTAYSAFVDGFMQGATTNDPKAMAKAIGMLQGMQHSQKGLKQMAMYLFEGDSTKSINQDAIIAGYVASFTEASDIAINSDSARKYVQAFQQKQYAKAMEKQYADWKKQNEDFLAENAKKDGVKTTASGLQYKIETMGQGEAISDTTQVSITYTGTLIDGTQFDSSIKPDAKTKKPKDNPFKCKPTSSIIKGWKEALKTFPVGTKCTIYVPSDLGYGAQNTGRIKPFSTLIFEMEIKK